MNFALSQCSLLFLSVQQEASTVLFLSAQHGTGHLHLLPHRVSKSEGVARSPEQRTLFLCSRFVQSGPYLKSTLISVCCLTGRLFEGQRFAFLQGIPIDLFERRFKCSVKSLGAHRQLKRRRDAQFFMSEASVFLCLASGFSLGKDGPVVPWLGSESLR